ncbi:hypothetical protein ACTXT7_002071 [Hymenolepis weldensis]
MTKNLIEECGWETELLLEAGSLCALILAQLLIVNLESVRDRTSSAVNCLGCLMIFVVSLLSTWNTVSYKLRIPELNQPGFIEPPTSEDWTLSNTPYELTEYLYCAYSFINYFLAFFSDRHIPSTPPLILTRPIRPEELPIGFDVVASDEAVMKLAKRKSNEKSSEPDLSPCPVNYLWAVDSKNLAAHIVPVFLRSIYKYLRVDISGELDALHTANSQFSDSVSNTSYDRKSGIVDANLNTGNSTTSDEASARRSTFAEFSVSVEGAAGAKEKFEKRQRTLSGVPDIGKKPS